MFAENIEQIKQDWTDKYVVVDATLPELARFRELVGQVKTVNMSGRALVEFMDYHLNVGWYDIDRAYLKQVSKPEPKPAEAKAKPAAKPAAEKKPAADAGAKKLSPLELARQQGAGGAAKPAGAKTSTADILAAARGGAAPARSDKPAAKPAEAKPAPAASGAPAKVDRAKMSVADMLAMARGDKPGGAPPASKPSESVAPPPEEAKAAAETVAAAPVPSTEPAQPQRVDKSGMDVDQMLAYCRQTDGR
ncbi:MAG: hypothetical protein KF847_07105 [Pirellulales bacterium]|nr:hypothetical protein [Pirellulales bacterium]